MDLVEFNYNLPKELVAQYPIEKRDASRLLVIDRANKKIYHKNFVDLSEHLSGGDCVILNDTKVIPARLIGKRKTGGLVDVLLLEKKNNNTYSCLIKPKRLKNGERINFTNGKFSARFIDTGTSAKKLQFECNGKLQGMIEKYGLMPLPPYIKRMPEKLDKKTYQTIYAKNPGAIAAPTAGLHFTREVFENLKKKGINTAFITLHVGWATFRPVRCENIEQHRIEKEYFKINKKTAEIINKTKENGKKVLAVGTTTCRVLESVPDSLNQQDGFTDLFIYPPYKFKIVDMLLTNFHLPKTTLLMLVSAFCPKKLLFKAYREAIDRKYRFYSYGDAMLIV